MGVFEDVVEHASDLDVEVEVEKPGRDRLDVVYVLDAELVGLSALGDLGERSRALQSHRLVVHIPTVERTADTGAGSERNQRGSGVHSMTRKRLRGRESSGSMYSRLPVDLGDPRRDRTDLAAPSLCLPVGQGLVSALPGDVCSGPVPELRTSPLDQATGLFLGAR